MDCDGIRPCPACGNFKGQSIGNKNMFEILNCSVCHTLYTASLPAGEEAEDYDQYYSESKLFVPTFVLNRVHEIVGTFSAYRKLNRLLDIGFGAGTILEVAADQNWNAYGIEVSKPAVDAAIQAGHNVFHGSLREAAYPSNYFDVVTSSEILEHLDYPKEELKEIWRVLRPGGLFW